MWQREPVLNDLLVLLKDGKPVSSFPEGYAHDQIWTEIACAIDRRTRDE
jgi:hypothetical protein